jgi:hypothetical protein
MLTYVPIITYSSISIAIYGALFIPLLARSMDDCFTETEKNAKACVVMIFIGAGEIIGSMVNGRILDKCGLKVFTVSCMI